MKTVGTIIFLFFSFATCASASTYDVSDNGFLCQETIHFSWNRAGRSYEKPLFFASIRLGVSRGRTEGGTGVSRFVPEDKGEGLLGSFSARGLDIELVYRATVSD